MIRHQYCNNILILDGWCDTHVTGLIFILKRGRK